MSYNLWFEQAKKGDSFSKKKKNENYKEESYFPEHNCIYIGFFFFVCSQFKYKYPLEFSLCGKWG